MNEVSGENNSTDTGSSSSLKRTFFAVIFSIVFFVVILELGALATLKMLDIGDLSEARESVLTFAETNTSTPIKSLSDDDNSGEAPAYTKHEVVHPYLGYVRKPVEGYPDAITEFGLEGPNSPIQKRRPGTIIVGIVGGSFANEFARESLPPLEEALKASPEFEQTEFVFVNAALGGYKQPQALMTLNYLLAAGGELDWVINIDGFNEVALHRSGNLRQGVSAIYPRSWYFRAEDIPDVELRNLEGHLVYLKNRRVALAETFSKPMLSAFSIGNLLWHSLDQRSLASINRGLLAIEQHRPAAVLPILRGPQDEFVDDGAMQEEMVAIWNRSSLQLSALCEGMGIKYFHFLQPNQYDPDSKPLSDYERENIYVETSRFREDVEAAYPLLRESGARLRENGVAFDDMSTIFTTVEESLYEDPCYHLNHEGYDRVATYIAEAIIEY